MPETCKTCRFNSANGQCHRNPPVVVYDHGISSSSWLIVRDDGWCGEWKPKDEKNAD